MTRNGEERDGVRWIRDEANPRLRSWEEFYRNRWQHDKVVRSTHGVNCTGSCTWNIHVKDGIVTWEMQGLDYPALQSGLPPYEPRGCQRGPVSSSPGVRVSRRVMRPSADTRTRSVRRCQSGNSTRDTS